MKIRKMPDIVSAEAGSETRRISNLQIKSPCVGVDVDHFAGKVQVGDQPAAHGTGFNLFYADTAAGDDGFSNGPGRLYGQRQSLEHGEQRFPLGSGDLVAGQDRGDVAKPGEDFRKAGGQQARQDAFQLFLSGFGKVPAKTGVQLFTGKPRLQVNGKPGALGRIRQVAAGFQRQGAGDSEVGEKHFPQLGV